MVAARITRKQLRRKLWREALERCEDMSEPETWSDVCDAFDDAYVACEADTHAAEDAGGEERSAPPRTARARRVRAKHSERLRAQQRAKKSRQNLCASEEYVLDMASPRARSVSPVVVENTADMPWMICDRNNDVRELQEVHETQEALEPRRRRRHRNAFAAVYNDGERFRERR